MEWNLGTDHIIGVYKLRMYNYYRKKRRMLQRGRNTGITEKMVEGKEEKKGRLNEMKIIGKSEATAMRASLHHHYRNCGSSRSQLRIRCFSRTSSRATDAEESWREYGGCSKGRSVADMN